MVVVVVDVMVGVVLVVGRAEEEAARRGHDSLGLSIGVPGPPHFDSIVTSTMRDC